jgi:ATP dependent DNA ligase domain
VTAITIRGRRKTEGDGAEMFKAVCKLGLEGIVSKKLDSPYKSGPSKAWLKIKNPNAPAATRARWTGLSSLRPGCAEDSKKQRLIGI